MAFQIFSSKYSTVTVTSDSGPETLSGLQSIEYKVVLNKEDHYEGGNHLRQYITYGNKVIQGLLRIKSTSSVLDQLLDKMSEEKGFSLQAILSDGKNKKTLNFEGCYLEGKEYNMDVNGHGISAYSFSAQDMKQA